MSERVRIRIGNQTSFSAPTILQPFEYAVANGFDAFEWFPDRKESGTGWTESDMSKETRIIIRDTALAHDISLSVHAPNQLNPLTSETEFFLQTIRFAHDISAILLNIHLYPDNGIGEYVETIIPIIKHLAEIGIRLSIENTPDTGPHEFNELFRHLRSKGLIHAGNIGMCFDLGHANLCEETRNDYLKYIDMLDPLVPVIHIHMHENYGDSDSHLPIFTGPAGNDASGINGLIERMKKRNFSGSIILEQWPYPESLLNEARTRLLDIIGKFAEPSDHQEKGTAEGMNFWLSVIQRNHHLY
jgi:sugar phosphate isomerase/epimerase